MKQHRILLLDGIRLWPIGTEFYQALKEVYNETYFLGQEDFSPKYFYNLRRIVSRMRGDKPTNYVHPKLIYSQVKAKIMAIRPTIVIVIGYSHNLIHKGDLEELKRKLGFQLVLWDTDSVNYGQTIQFFEEYINHEFMRYDRIFSFSSAVVRYMNRLNLVPCDYLHFGAIAYNHALKSSPEKNIDVCFAGLPNVRRAFLLSGIENEKMCIVGKKWKKYGEILPKNIKEACLYKNCLGDELYEILLRSKIIVNITGSYFYGVYSGITLRFFEAIALKSFLLTDDFPEIHDLFTPGKEIETYSNYEEFVDKAAFYSKNDDSRNKIAAAGYEKFINNYTWNHQARKMLDLLGVAY